MIPLNIHAALLRHPTHGNPLSVRQWMDRTENACVEYYSAIGRKETLHLQ